MRALSPILFLVLAAPLIGCATGNAHAAQKQESAENDARNKKRCASFGFKEGTDAFANCVMQFSLRQERQAPPDRETLIRQYRDRSMARRGDDRYPVCTAGMMENELDIMVGKWVGPNCQMAPD